MTSRRTYGTGPPTWTGSFAALAVAAGIPGLVVFLAGTSSFEPHSDAGADAEMVAEVEVSPAILDLGAVQEGSHKSAAFTLKNRSRAEVTIESVQPDCSCTVVAASRSVIAPGAEFRMPMEFRASVGMTNAFEKKIRVQVSASGAMKQLTLRVRGRVDPRRSLLAYPATVDLGDRYPGETAEATVYVRGSAAALSKLPDRIVMRPGGTTSLALDFDKSVADLQQKRILLVAELPKVNVTGTFQSSLRLHDSGIEPGADVAVQVVGRTTPPVSAVPSRVLVAVSSGAERARAATFQIRGRSANLAVEGLTSDLPLVLTHAANVPGGGIQVTAKYLSPVTPAVPVKGTIGVRVSAPVDGIQVLEVPVVLAPLDEEIK